MSPLEQDSWHAEALGSQPVTPRALVAGATAEPGWKRLESRSTPGAFYYFHVPTGTTSLEPPVPWEKRESRSNPGDFYYFNRQTGQRTWVKPEVGKASARSHCGSTVEESDRSSTGHSGGRIKPMLQKYPAADALGAGMGNPRSSGSRGNPMLQRHSGADAPEGRGSRSSAGSRTSLHSDGSRSSSQINPMLLRRVSADGVEEDGRGSGGTSGQRSTGRANPMLQRHAGTELMHGGDASERHAHPVESAGEGGRCSGAHVQLDLLRPTDVKVSSLREQSGDQDAGSTHSASTSAPQDQSFEEAKLDFLWDDDSGPDDVGKARVKKGRLIHHKTEPHLKGGVLIRGDTPRKHGPQGLRHFMGIGKTHMKGSIVEGSQRPHPTTSAANNWFKHEHQTPHPTTSAADNSPKRTHHNAHLLGGYVARPPTPRPEGKRRVEREYHEDSMSASVVIREQSPRQNKMVEDPACAIAHLKGAIWDTESLSSSMIYDVDELPDCAQPCLFGHLVVRTPRAKCQEKQHMFEEESLVSECGSPTRACSRHTHLLGTQLVCDEECCYTDGKQEDFFHQPVRNITGSRVEVIRENTPRNRMMGDPDWDWTRSHSHLGGAAAAVVTDPNCEAPLVKQKRLLANFASRQDLSRHVYIETRKSFGKKMQASENLDGPAAEVISEAETRLVTIGRNRENVVVGRRKYIPRPCNLRGSGVDIKEEDALMPAAAGQRQQSRKKLVKPRPSSGPEDHHKGIPHKGKKLVKPRSSSWGPSYS